MKIALQYVSDVNGKHRAVQIPVSEWEKVLSKLKKYEQVLQIKSDLEESFKQVAALKKSKAKHQSLRDFLNEI